MSIGKSFVDYGVVEISRLSVLEDTMIWQVPDNFSLDLNRFELREQLEKTFKLFPINSPALLTGPAICDIASLSAFKNSPLLKAVLIDSFPSQAVWNELSQIKDCFILIRADLCERLDQLVLLVRKYIDSNVYFYFPPFCAFSKDHSYFFQTRLALDSDFQLSEFVRPRFLGEIDTIAGAITYLSFEREPSAITTLNDELRRARNSLEIPVGPFEKVMVSPQKTAKAYRSAHASAGSSFWLHEKCHALSDKIYNFFWKIFGKTLKYFNFVFVLMLFWPLRNVFERIGGLLGWRIKVSFERLWGRLGWRITVGVQRVVGIFFWRWRVLQIRLQGMILWRYRVFVQRVTGFWSWRLNVILRRLDGLIVWRLRIAKDRASGVLGWRLHVIKERIMGFWGWRLAKLGSVIARLSNILIAELSHLKRSVQWRTQVANIRLLGFYNRFITPAIDKWWPPIAYKLFSYPVILWSRFWGKVAFYLYPLIPALIWRSKFIFRSPMRFAWKINSLFIKLYYFVRNILQIPVFKAYHFLLYQYKKRLARVKV